ncbi:MAG: NAD-dependent epimerase/dehydratase family protein [Anaerolineae bacterium]
MVLKRASAFIKHPAGDKDAFLITTRYGRKLKVTGDHSIFRRGIDGLPEAIPVRQLTEDDYIALPAYLPVIEKDGKEVNLGETLISQATCDENLWEFALVSQQLDDYLVEHKDQIYEILMASPRFDGSQNKWNTVGCQFRKYRQKGLLPLYVIAALETNQSFEWPEDGRLRPYTAGGGTSVPNRVKVSDDLLWLLGFYLAEGTAYRAHGNYMISMCSDERFLERAAQTLTEHFNVRVGRVKPSPGHGPQIYVHSKVLHTFFEEIFQVTGYSHELRIPSWVMQLPLSRLKFFLEGYRQGDGTHTNYLEQRELAFNTSSQGLATDLIYLLMRFGIVGSLGEHETTFSERYGDRKFPFWGVTVCEVSDFNILNWDQGVEQTLNATRLGDLVWAKIRSIEPIEATDYVYDFSVPGAENFMAGSGVLAHNTYGPRMQLDDGRVVPNFVGQALRHEPLTVYGDGSQTRSFCYIDDLVDGIVGLLDVRENEPVNLGNPREISILDFAKKINDLTGNPAGIVYKPLPPDDPSRRCPDITKARQLLAWEPTVGLDEGMGMTIAWFQQRLAV